MYSHDQDLIAWFILDVLNNQHIRLIGQETSQSGVFIGPLFYYLMIPFYALTNMHPIGGIIFSTIIGLLTILSIYWVFEKIVNKRVGLLGAFIYAINFTLVFTDREVVPTTPVVLWSTWFLYSLYLLLNNKKERALIILGVLIGLIWHLNMGLILTMPLVVLAIIFTGKYKFKLKPSLIAMGLFGVLVMPYLIFELRHGWTQTQSILSIGDGISEFSLADRFDRVLQLLFTNLNRIASLDYLDINRIYSVYLFIGIYCLIYIKKIIDKSLADLLLFWVVIYIVFFSLNTLNPSEYYFNGLTVVWVFILSLGFEIIYKFDRKFLYLLIGIYLIINLSKFFSVKVNKSGYLERQAIVSEIKRDARAHNYPCVSVSYIVKPGFDLGYRYLFYLENMHVNRPDSGSPVYSIVFPHSMVNSIDKAFGALGLIYPNYEKYNDSGVIESCSGANSNLTDPMFGFTN